MRALCVRSGQDAGKHLKLAQMEMRQIRRFGATLEEIDTRDEEDEETG